MGFGIDKRISLRVVVIAVAALLAGCEGSVSVGLGTTEPANPNVSQVLVDLNGVEFEKSSGDTETLEFSNPERVNLNEFLDGGLFQMFTDEQLSEGQYTGVRLLFEVDDNDTETVVLATGEDFPLNLGTSNFTDVDFTIEDDDSSEESVVLTLDLRQSLAFDDDTDEYTLTPVVRAARQEDTGGLAGSVDASCPVGGAAVYLFTGNDITPDDRDGIGVDPYLTAAVSSDSYAFGYVPEGDYTLALTCDGDEDDAATDDNDDVDFERAVNVSVDAGETATENVTD